MTVNEYLSIHDMTLGTAKPEIVRQIMHEGESVGPELAYKLTGKPDQIMTIRSALLAAGCHRATC